MNKYFSTLFLVTALSLVTHHSYAATFIVESSSDTGGTPASCNVSDGCTLRQAINLANSTTGTENSITFDPVVTTVTLIGASGEDSNASGDFDILSSITITGNGQNVTTISGGGLDRVFHIIGGHTVNFNDLKITGGGGSYTGFGGGIYNASGTTNVNNSTFFDNLAGIGGGGIYNAGTLAVSNSTFSGNNASTAGPTQGGGIYNNGGTLTIINSTFINNFVGGLFNEYGGGISNDSGTLTVTNSTFSGNQAPDGGGGIYNNGTISAIINSTFSENSSTSSQGGGIDNDDTITIIANTIIANSPSGGNCAGVPAGTNNLTDSTGCDSWADASLVPAEDLGTLASNGGPTKTIALLGSAATNPAIDTGDLDTCTNAPVNGVDQRGITRPQGTNCDIGAYELEVFPWPMFLPAVTSGAQK